MRKPTRADVIAVFEAHVPDIDYAGGWGVPTDLEDDGWTFNRYMKALTELRQVMHSYEQGSRMAG